MDTTTLNPTDSPEGVVWPKKATDSPEEVVQPLGAADKPEEVVRPLKAADRPEGAVWPKKATDKPEEVVQPLKAADRRYFFEKLQRRYHDCVESAVACLVILQSKTRCRHEYALYTKVKHLLEAYDNLLSAPQLETLPSTQACHAEFYATRELGHVSVCGLDELSETALHADYRENIVSACNTLATATDLAPNAETRAELVARQHVLYTATDITPDKKGKTREKRQKGHRQP